MASKAASVRLAHQYAFRTTSPLRAIALGAGAAGLIVHLLWRIDYSLVGLTPTGLTLSSIMFAAEAFIAAALIVAAIADILPAALSIEAQSVPEQQLPSVDLFVLISDPKQAPKAAYSLAVASQLDYPRELVRLYLVGYGKATDNASSLLALAERTGASWLAASTEAPAGSAVNAALARTGGSLVMVLNAGDAPLPDLLRRVAGGFIYNPRLAYCDTPVFPIDGDPMLTDIDVTQRMPNDPGHFFKSCLKAAGGVSSSMGINTRSVWRRAALSASGFLTRTSYRADAVARIRAAEQSWQRGITRRPLVASLAPDTVRDYLHHRLALRLGTIEAALMRDPILGRGLTMRERLSWLPALFQSIQPLMWSVLIAIPPIAVLLNIPILAGASTRDGILISLSGLVIALIMSGALYSGFRSLLIGMWSELLETFLSAPSILLMMRGRDQGEATPHVERANSLLITSFALLLAGTAASVTIYNFKPEFQSLLAAPAALTIFSACFVACLLGAIAEPRQRRLSPRVSKRFHAELLLGGETFFGRLADVSIHGARFIADELVDLPARALRGVITLNGPAGKSTLPVQLSRQTEASGRSAFGLSFTGRTVGEFATVVRLAHRSGDAYADLCDARAKPAGLLRLLPILTMRGIGDFLQRMIFRRKPSADFVRLASRKKSGT